MDAVGDDMDRGLSGDKRDRCPPAIGEKALPEEDLRDVEIVVSARLPPPAPERPIQNPSMPVLPPPPLDLGNSDDHIELRHCESSTEVTENPLTTVALEASERPPSLIPATNHVTEEASERPPSLIPATNHVTEEASERPPSLRPATSHVTECATVYSVLMACITTGFTALYAYFAQTSDEKVSVFWIWITLPIAISAMSISFVLKPKREDRAYKVALLFQYVLFSFVSEFLSVVGHDFAKIRIIMSCVKALFWLISLKIGMKVRSHVASLSDEDLSNFLMNDVIFGGMLVGLAQLAFIMFGSIQCDGNADDWRQCSRTLYSQAGLSFMVTLFTIIKLLSGVVPKRVLAKHVISPKKVLAMDLKANEAVQFFGLFLAAGCALYLLGNYGSEGDFWNNTEEFVAYTVPSIGCGCLLLTAAWKAIVIRGEMINEAEETGQLHQGESSSDGTLVEGSSFWFYIGVLASTYAALVVVASAVTMDKFYNTLSRVSIPIVGLLYVGSFFGQPRRRSPKDMWKLRLHFMSFAFIGEMSWAVFGFREGNFGLVILHVIRLAAQTLLFHFGLKIRATVGRLPDKELETFLVDTLFKGGLQTLLSILFLTFRTTKCMFEKGSLARCSNISTCSTTISVYLLLWWLTKLVQGSVRSEWRKDLNLSIEKIARMRNISLRRGATGFLTLVTGVCGIFLFSMMSADELDETTISVVSFTGLAASFGAAVSEAYTSLKAQDRLARESENGQMDERASEIEEPVEEVSGDEFHYVKRVLNL
ncbi:hypothetical protein TrVE_jg3053 [Triparma verrucosa]|uniref:Uncharacterized protein n=1 Tax=Triparma verrucosa TaxID=1606542 RepID=A0A9W6ZBL1_9STRA|nr:hypothetical protein TrVE_jg3053 [Triparma verrucosa]